MINKNFLNRAVYDIMCKNVVQTDRSHVTIWRMRITYWIPKTTDTHSEYVIIIDFPLQHCFHESFAHIACLGSLIIQCVCAGFVSGRSSVCIVTRHGTR